MGVLLSILSAQNDSLRTLKLLNIFLLPKFIFYGRSKYNMTFHQWAKSRGGWEWSHVWNELGEKKKIQNFSPRNLEADIQLEKHTLNGMKKI